MMKRTHKIKYQLVSQKYNLFWYSDQIEFLLHVSFWEEDAKLEYN